jgi:Protein of unknown function (DUF3606)
MPQPSADPGDRIDLEREDSVRRWCEHFGVTLEQLTEAVRAAGHAPADVREHLLRQGGSAGAG